MVTATSTSGSGAFADLLVVEIGDSRAGAYCAKQFGDLGAEVHTLGPGIGAAGSEFYATSVHDSTTLDHRARRALLDAADIVIQASAHGPLTELIEPVQPTQIVVRVSPFATSGPYGEWQSSDLVDAAIAGHLRLSGDPDREPLQGVPDIVHHGAGMMAFIGAVAALIARHRCGVGQVVETSHHEVIVALHQFTLLRYTHNGNILGRLGNRYAGPGSPIGGYECADGWIGLSLPQDDQVERLLEVTGLISMLDRDDVGSIWDLMVNPTLLDSELIPYLKTQPRDELVELFQALRLPCAPTSTMADLLADEHLAAREFWQSATSPDGDAVSVPGPPFRLSNHKWAVGAKTRPTSAAPAPAQGNADPAPDLSAGPLAGLRVIDMTRVWAGPLAARFLADLGAEVLMTEVPWTRTPREVAPSYVESSHFFPDDEAGDRPWNRTGFHNKYAVNKQSAVIELDKPEGLALMADLIPSADVLIENYSPRVMPGFGLDETALHDLNPELVYVTMPGYGRDGPHTDWVAYGPTIDGHVGHTTLTGYRGEGPWKCGIAWPDPIGGMHGAAAALVGLLDRMVSSDPGGSTAEVAQIESAVNMIGQHVVAAQHDGEPVRHGNRRPGRAPQGVYPCSGDDRWIAISIMDDDQWHAVCDEFGWADLRTLGLDERWQRHDELDDRLAQLTSTRNDIELMHELQALGVAAGAVLDAADVLSDPQLDAIGAFAELDHADSGRHPWARFPVRLAGTPATMRTPAPLMGEHNALAACELAGRSTAEYQQLVDREILRTEPPA